jgi:hypothetical protein
MDLASQTRRADDLFPYTTYHHTKAPMFGMGGFNTDDRPIRFLEARRGRAEHKDVPAIHTGSYEAAHDRGRRQSGPQILDLRFRAESPLINANGVVMNEREIESMVRNVPVSNQEYDDFMELKKKTGFGYGYFPEMHIKQDKFRQLLLDEGYDIIPYINQAEDVGSISFMHLRPETDLRMRGAAFDPAKKDAADLMAGVALPALFTGGAVANQRRKRED